MSRTTPRKRYTVKLSRFLGVDFANEETDTDLRRSPWAPNMVSDMAGRPEVRPGYQQEVSFSARINGIHHMNDTLLIHAGTSMYLKDGTVLRTGCNDARSCAFVMNDALYILDGAGYYCFDGQSVAPVEGFVPTTTIGRMPTGGGTTFESVNLIQPLRKNSFIGDGTATAYQLDAESLDAAAVTAWVDGETLEENAGFTVDRAAGIVTFSTAPSNGHGVDNVVIRFARTVEGYADRILHCTTAALFGLGNDSRVFVTGNPSYKNTDWQSGLYDPTYFPDLGYTRLGGEDTAIMGYIKQYDAMVVLKEQQSGQTGLFLRTAELTEDGSAIFPVKEGLSGVGAISRHAFASLQSDQVFLSAGGVMGLESNAITNQRTVQLRSWFINPKLTRSHNLQEAVAAVWGRFYVLSVDGVCYVANMESTNQNPTGSFGYEWYYWTNVPARVLAVVGGALYFGTAEGNLMRFKDPATDGMQAYSDRGSGIDAMWTTPLLDGGDFLRKKSVCTRGTGILAKPYARSSGEIFFTTDKSVRELSRGYTLDILNFDDVDFSRFSFNTRDNPQPQLSARRFRDVLQFQMGVRHSVANEGFGILAMTVTYMLGANLK